MRVPDDRVSTVRLPDGTWPIQGEDETLDAFIIRAFGGREFPCERCKALKRSSPAIRHIGICERCEREIEAEAAANTPAATAEAKLERSGVPSTMLGYRWEGSQPPEGVRLSDIRGWEGNPWVMSIIGPVGTGKSGAAFCVLRDWILNGGTGRWIECTDWWDELRYLEGEGGGHQAIRTIIEFRGLVVLDDPITNRSTQFSVDKLLQVLQGRMREGRPTIVTTNYRLEVIGKEYDPRIESRLSSGLVLKWVGKDRRGGVKG